MVQDKAQIAGNGNFPCQELQHRIGPFVGLPSGAARNRHLRRLLPCKGSNHLLRNLPCS